MLIINLKGGLGNQMFQYATGRALAQKNNAKLLLDTSGFSDPRVVNSDTPRTFDLDHFNIKAEIATEQQIKTVKYPKGPLSKIWRAVDKKILKNHYVDYHPELLQKLSQQLERGDDVYLDGFFQSEKNFAEIRPQLLEELSLESEYISSRLLDWQNKIKQTDSVSIHIRRGDYANNPATKKYHGLCPISYYRKAIELLDEIHQNPHFYIFTDDIAWTKENLKLNNENTYISGNDLSYHQELYLMSQCQDNIIANSSFSWWGAWLNQNDGKNVIAPEKWTVKNIEHPNIIPDSWIRLS